jgi:hypothetical protein
MNNELTQNLASFIGLLLYAGLMYTLVISALNSTDFQSPELREKYYKLKLPFMRRREP